MNTVLDDNKVLTLLNGDRIGLPPEVGLIFEVEDLSAASPATVSRCGMVYMDINELGWKPYVDSWIDKKKDAELRAYLDELFYKWIRPLLETKRKFCKELVPCNNVNLVISLCKVLDALNAVEAGLKFDDPPKSDEYWLLLEKWFAFALLWSVGATVTEESRKLIDSKFRDIESFFPANNVYDYYINAEKSDWTPWEEKLTSVWKPPANTPFHKLIVPTVDTYRNRYILQTLLKAKAQILVVGQTGTGKTAIINSLLGSLDDTYSSFYLNFSAQTTSAKTQEIIESKLVRRAKGKMTPDAGKKGIIFIDDLNMPRKDLFGSQPPLELLRQYIEYGGWYDRQSLDIFKVIDNVQLVTAMGPPGGGRAEISQRFQSKFNTINFTFPSDSQVKRIFQSILSSQLNNLDEEIRPLTDPLASATINLYLNIQSTFLPTPTRAHYVFNMRDISKVIQGVCQIEYCDTKLSLIKVWVHESLRVFYDRMVSEDDRNQLKKLIGDRLELELNSNLKDCSNGEDDTVFVDFIDEDNQNYQEVSDKEKLKSVVKAKLDNYNETIRGAPLNIVMFKEAILNLCKIYRIIKLSRGHGLLIGEGGSGRHSLTRLAAFICNYKPFQIKITKNYENKQFREDLKKFCEEVGTRRTPGVFIFSDNEIIQESFIEDVNSLISSGEVPNLFKKEEAAAIRDKCRKDAKAQKIETEEGIWEFFLNKVQSNLHVILCMSKTGDNLRNYTRMYPGLINNTTIVWFMPWPQEALYEVADHYLQTLSDVDANSKKAMSGFFSDTHTQVLSFANKMWLELKRLYYVTATNYIELVQGYLALLQEKRKEVGNEINKLNLGLEKLAEAGRNMEELSVALDHAHNDLTQKQKDCEELMIRITHESREADEKQKEVEQKKAVLEKDRIETENLAGSAKADLDAAMPALMEASEKIDKLTNSEFAEIKAYSTPPEPVMAVMSVILIFLGKVKDVSWASAKSALSDPNFVSNLKDFSQKEKDNISTRTLNKVEKYTSRADMSPADVRKISSAAGTLWEWCLAMEKYAKAWRDIEPKRNNVRKLEDKLKKNEDELRQLEEKYLALKAEVDRLKSRYEQANDDKEKFKNDAQELRIKLERAEKLVYSLSSSKERWAADKRRLLEQYENLIGDALLSAAMLSYAGPFPSEYRERLVNTVMLPYIKSMKIPHSRFYNFADFLAKPTDIQKWNGQGLPTDAFSIENGVVVVKSRRWPLMIDPQMQANKWIKSMEKEKLILLDPQTENYMAKIERAIFDGLPVLLQNIGEDIDPSLDPVLNKSLKQVGDRTILVMGDREIGYNHNFKLYMTTKFSNPKYKAEVSTKVTLVNFTVKEKGLEEQLLGKLIENLEPELEKRKNELVQKTAKNQAKLKESDDEVLRLLLETKGSLVDDDTLVNKLQASKATEDEIKQQIESSSQTMKKTLALRENYRPLGTMASHLFFVLNDLNKIDHMYQFSLESYIDLFVQAIPKKEERHMMLDTLQSKLDTISERHKLGVYKYACRSLFEKDKILLSMQMTAKLSDKVNPEEYSFFLRGVGTVDRTQQPPNPAPEWLSQSAWDAINTLDKIPKFDGLVGSFMNSTKEWRRWYMSEAPESEVLPGEWSNRFDTPLRMMILLKAMRPDRVMLACREFVEKGLGDKFVNPPEVNFEKIYEDSKPSTPIVVILSPGVDPYPQVEALAQRLKIPLYPLSLGQGQSDRAKDKIGDGVKNGHWVFLANCHLSISFLAELEKLLEKLRIDELDPSTNKFRLWLTTNPHPKFSISILQKSIKVTTEPPRGLKANMLRLYTQMQEEQFRVDDKQNYKKLLFCLCWFHSVIIERKRFKSLGWNVSYDFNDSDFQICENIIKNYLDKSARGVDESAKIIPWDAIRYLIYEINYGGRVTDECDRTLLKVYASEFFNERVITEENFNLADPNLEFQYIVPDDEGWKPPQDKGKELQFKSQTAFFFETEIRKYPDIDPPGAFGQHINAVISSQIADTNTLIESILSLQPRESSQGTETMEEVVEKIVNDLKDKVPEIIPMEEVEERNKHIPDDDPYKIVLKQEITRYNKLLVTLEASLKSLLDGIKGRILISEDLEKIMESLFESKVPRAWKFTYPSLKPLNSWMVDLNARIKEFRDWALKGQPMVFWISSFTYPKGFLTAILQQTAKKLPKVSIDMLGLDFYFLNTENVTKSATEGVYVQGLYLEGAKWDWNKSILVDADAMTLHYKMPVMQFRPIITEGKKQKKGQSLYNCPTYMYPVRGDSSFVLYINLPCGTLTDPSFWVKRGTALLMSLQD